MRAEQLPEIGITQKKAIGASAYDEQGFFRIMKGQRIDPGYCTLMHLAEALETRHEFDAWFCTYRLARAGQWQPHQPRCKKEALPSMRAHGYELFSTAMVLDYDNPGHAPWSDTLREAFEASITKAHERGFPFALAWSHLYYTNNGARLIYIPETPIVVDRFEPHIRGMIGAFFSQGIIIDPACADWTRLFRLPYVMREGDNGNYVNTWDNPSCSILTNEQAEPIDIVKHVPAVDKSKSTVTISNVDAPMPEPNECVELLEEVSAAGRTVKTPWYKEARNALKDRDCYPALFGNQPLAPAGERNSAIQRLVGGAVSVLYHKAGTSRELVFALFADPARRLNENDPSETEDWQHTTWAAICRYWAQEEAKQIREDAEEERFAESVKSLEQLLLDGVRTWCDHPALYEDDESALWWVREHLLVMTDKSIHVMRPDGRYDPMPNPLHGVKARIRALRMEGIIPLEEASKNGMKAVHVQSLIDRHATRARIVAGACGIKGGIIRNVEDENAVLEFGLYKIKDLEPRFDPDIATWLEKLTRLCPRMMDWLAHFGDLTAPICALSIVGPPGCGKKLLARGLAEIFDTEIAADKNVFGQYKTMLLSTPFVVVNEGWPEGSQASLADQFRSFVGGDETHVEQKYKDTVIVRAPIRLMITANNVAVVQALTGKRDLSPMDRDALLEKLLHAPIGSEASDYLRTMGGLQFTKGWVRGDDGSPSDYRLARHILWLHKNRRPPRAGARYLVEGERDNPMLFHMISTKSGRAPEVIEALVHMIENTGGTPGISTSGAQIFVTVNGVINYMRQHFPETRTSHISVGSALRALVVEGSSLEPRRLVDGKGDAQIARWREIDPSLLFEEALEQGYPCTRLQEIFEQHRTADRVANEAARATMEDV